MWPKLLIVVACLYVVKASVVPSIFDDEDVSNLAEVTRTARSCSFSGCNSFCRKLGHARGVCIGTYCQCRFRRRRSLDEEAEVPYTETFEGNGVVNNGNPEAFVAVFEDESSEDVSNLVEDTQTARSYGYDECNKYCRQLGFARGVCIGTYCQCRYQIAPLTPSVALHKGKAVGNGHVNEPFAHAIQNGDKRAVPVNEITLDASEYDREARAARSCGYTECNNHCRRLGYARGVCIGTYCQCRSRLARSADMEEGAAVETKVEATDNTPVSSDAETFAGAAAVTDADKLIANEDSNDAMVRACSILSCNRICRQLGFLRGVCIGSTCQCRDYRSFSKISENIIEDNYIIPTIDFVTGDELNPEDFEARSEDCNLRWCEQNCRRIGFSGGACVNGRCKCDILRLAIPAVPAPFTQLENEDETDSRAVRSCTASSCLQICRRLGFRYSRCANGRCICWR